MDSPKQSIFGRPYLQLLQVAVFGGAVLYFAKDIFIPVSYALLISFVLYPFCAWLEKKGIGKLGAILIAVTLMMLAGLLLVGLLAAQLFQFVSELPALQSKFYAGIEQISQFIIESFGVSKERQNLWLRSMTDQSGFNVMQFLRNTLSASAFSIVMLLLVPVYAVLILFYRRHWLEIVYRIFPAEEKSDLREIIRLTTKTYYSFIKGMMIVYLIVGTLNSVGLLILGIPHAVLFGFIASVLTFIPYIGITVGSLLPVAMAWITYDSVWYPLGVIGIFVFVQYLEANLIFPLAVSRKLSVNTLVMLLSIFAGGVLWGMSGMILFVPFVGIAKLVADHNPKWKTVSMILGMPEKKQDEAQT